MVRGRVRRAGHACAISFVAAELPNPRRALCTTADTPPLTSAELESFVVGPLANAMSAVEATGAVRLQRGKPERLVLRAIGTAN